MKKTLLFLVSLLMTMGAWAQTKTLWSEDFSSYDADDVPSGGTYNYVCEGSTKVFNEALSGGTAPELLVGKSGGSFSATVPTNGVTGTVNLTFKSNKNWLKVEINGTEIKCTQSGNDYSATVEVPSETENLTVKFSNSSKNARLDNIKLFTGTAKKAPGLSWGTASRTVTLGADDNQFPVLTNGNNLPVTYASSVETVATIASDGTITLGSAGTTEITASFAGNDEYEAGEVTYTLTVKEASSGDADISNTPETAYTVAKAIELIAANEGLDTKVYVKGKIASIKEVDTGQYGNATYDISDDGTTATTLTVYRGYYLGGEKFTSENQIKVGDEVVVYGKLVLYKSTNEINSGNNIYSLNGTTGINSITADVDSANAPVYNLSGLRVGKNAKGVLIKNGKKYVVK